MEHQIQNGFDTAPPYPIAALSSEARQAPIIQINGRKVLGPPLNWRGPPPPTACELHIRKIPRHLSEENLLPHLQRFGRIYEFRLMMEFSSKNRGYAFVRYMQKEDADRALEVLNHFYISPGRQLEVQRSYDKCRLFVGNIPKHLPEEQIEASFRQIFPGIVQVITLKRISDGQNNRGFVFIDFYSHEDALVVKKQVSPGSIRMWGQNLKVVWANPERTVDPETLNQTKTLFVRNVNLSVTTNMLYNILSPVVKRNDVVRMSRVRELAFITFSSRAAAEAVMGSLQGIELQGYPLHFEWALPPSANSVHSLKNCDFDAILRIKCIANYWSIPIIIYGRVFDDIEVQYAAIMIRSKVKLHVFFIEINISTLSDIQSRLCEVVVNLINKCGYLPMQNYVIKVKGDEAHIVGVINKLYKGIFTKAHSIPTEMSIMRDEFIDLCAAVVSLSPVPEGILYENYIQSLNTLDGVLLSIPPFHNRVITCVDPSYRQRPPLKHIIDNRQIIFILCSVYTLSNCIFPNMESSPWILKASSTNGNDPQGVSYGVCNLVSGHFAQPKNLGRCINAVRRFGNIPTNYY